MQKEALEIWTEVEKKINQKINHPGGVLYIKKRGHPDLKVFEKYGERISAVEMQKRWPALIIPDYLEGVFCKDGGVTKVKLALQAFKEESSKLGA